MSLSTLLNNNSTKTYTITSPFGTKMSFKFKYVYINSSYGWRAYIIGCPSYGYRPTDLHSTHRYYDENRGLYYVCWTVGLGRIEDMIEVSQLWARLTAKYIDYGETF